MYVPFQKHQFIVLLSHPRVRSLKAQSSKLRLELPEITDEMFVIRVQEGSGFSELELEHYLPSSGSIGIVYMMHML